MELLVAAEGFTAYGGLAGRNLDVLAIGLAEPTDPDHLAHRKTVAAWFADVLYNVGMPVMLPSGYYAVYLDAGALLPHFSPENLPGVALRANSICKAVSGRWKWARSCSPRRSVRPARPSRET
ncbi:hypothetical protein [Lentzea roselyniae]